MTNDKTPLQLKLDAQLQLLVPREDAPEDLKQEVFRTLDFLDTLGEITELFTQKFGETNAHFFDLFGEEE